MKFIRLFTLSILHDYYKSGLCPDFIVKPTPETQIKLNNYRLQFKPKPNGCAIIAKLNDDSSLFIEIPVSESFSFDLILQNQLFDNFTGSYDSGVIKLSRNSSSNTSWGTLELNCSDLKENNSFIFEKEFQIRFKANETYWDYYILTDDDISAKKITIEQNNLLDQKLTFKNAKEVSSASDPITEKIVKQFPDKKLFMVQSASKVNYSEAVEKNIELKIDGSVVIGHLPNPAINKKPNIIKYFNN